MTTKRTDPKPAKPRVPVRERLLATAGDLFYNEGIHAVGIDRVLAEAGVAKASLYDSFGSKEALVAAYLSSRQEARVERVQGIVDAAPDARAALLGIFASIGAQITAPAYRGCAFAKAGIEAEPGSQVRAVCDDARQWMLDLFGRLARQAGAAEPDALARQLLTVYDGTALAAHLDRASGQLPAIAAAAHDTAALLLDRHLPARP